MADILLPHQHSLYCLAVFSDAALANEILRALLDDELSADLVEGPPRLVAASTAGDDLSSSHMDARFLYARKSGGWLDLVLEHKSWADPRTPEQLHGYVRRAQDNPPPGTEGDERLVLGVVLYHGRQQWKVPGAVARSTEGTEPLLHRAGTFLYPLWNLMTLDLARLPVSRVAWAALGTMEGAFLQGDQTALVDAILQAMPADSRIERQTLVYLECAWGLEAGMLAARLETLKPKQKEALMNQHAKDLIAIGEERGMAVGAAQGKAELFSRLLEQKFGGLSAESRELVAQASPAQLEAWTARLFKARSLKAIFAD